MEGKSGSNQKHITFRILVYTSARLTLHVISEVW